MRKPGRNSRRQMQSGQHRLNTQLQVRGTVTQARRQISRRHQADTAFLEVRASNRPAIALYLSEGFSEVGQRRGYYPDGEGREDALVFARDLRW